MKIFGLQKIQPKEMKIREGMTVEDVKVHGSEGQKLAASLFDAEIGKDSGKYVKDGIFSKAEAERFNDFDFSMQKGIFTMYDKKSKQTTEIKYKDIEDLKRLLDDNKNRTGFLSFQGKNGRVLVGERTDGGKITLDLTNYTVTADEVKGSVMHLFGKKVTVQNSEVEAILGHYVEELEVKNTQLDRSLNKSEPTRILIDKDTKLKIDDVSDVDISRY